MVIVRLDILHSFGPSAVGATCKTSRSIGNTMRSSTSMSSRASLQSLNCIYPRSLQSHYYPSRKVQQLTEHLCFTVLMKLRQSTAKFPDTQRQKSPGVRLCVQRDPCCLLPPTNVAEAQATRRHSLTCPCPRAPTCTRIAICECLGYHRCRYLRPFSFQPTRYACVPSLSSLFDFRSLRNCSNE